jgi:hypothetical protein
MLRLAGIGLAVGLIALFGGEALAQHFSMWSAPTNLGLPVSTAAPEVCPCLANNDLSLYFGSFRPDSPGSVDLYVSQRASTSDPWGPPTNLGPIVNSTSTDNCPYVTPDGHKLIFLSNRPGSAGIDLYVSFRQNRRDDFGWEAPVPLTALNSPYDDFAPTGYEDEETGDLVLYFSSSRPAGPGGAHIFVSRTDHRGFLLPPALVTELASGADEVFPSVRRDGRELFFVSTRPGGMGGFDLWAAGRESTCDPWGVPENLGPNVNTAAIEQRPTISRDGRSLIFASNRDGNLDLYEITRSRLRSSR